MTRLTALVFVAALLAGCYEVASLPQRPSTDADTDSDSDSDSDSDVDSDTDSDSDSDSDTDSDADCGTTDAVCCEAEPYCAENHMNVTTDGTDCWCYESCELAMCVDDLDVWENDVACWEQSDGVGICYNEEELVASDCAAIGDTCTTPLGYTDGYCVSGYDATFYCFRACTPIADTGCDTLHTCTPLIFGSTGEYAGAACIPI